MNDDSTTIDDVKGKVIGGSIEGSRNITGDKVTSIIIESGGNLHYYNIDKEREETIRQFASSSTKVSRDKHKELEKEKIKPQSIVEEQKKNEQNVKETEKVVEEIEKTIGGKAENIQIGEVKFSTDEVTVKKKVLEGNRFFFKDSYQKAIESYEQATEIDPYYADAWYNMGNCYEKLQRYEDAIKFYDKVIEIDPKNASALYSKGTILSRETSKQKFIVCLVVSIIFLILISVFLDIGLKTSLIRMSVEGNLSTNLSTLTKANIFFALENNAGSILILIAAVALFFFIWYKEGHTYYGNLSPKRKRFILLAALVGIIYLWMFSAIFLHANIADVKYSESLIQKGMGDTTSILDDNQTLLTQGDRLGKEAANNIFGFFGSESLIITSAMITVTFALFLYNTQNAGEFYLNKARELGKNM